MQARFNHILRRRLGDQLVKEMCRVLPLSAESVYRRLRNETAYSFAEVGALAKAFGISVDELLHDSKLGVTAAVYHNSYERTGEIGELVHPYSLPEEDGHMLLVCKDLFMIHYLQVPLLYKFMIYYWKRVIRNSSELRGHSFNPSNIPDLSGRDAERLVHNYFNRPIVEVWNLNTLDPMLRRIEYSFHMGLLDNSDRFNDLFGAIDSYLQKLELRLDNSDKGDARLFGFYVTNLEPDLSVTFHDRGGVLRSRLYINPFNYLTLENPNVVEQLKNRFLSLLNTGVNIQGQSDIQRYQFFQNMRRKVTNVQQRLANNRDGSPFAV